MLMLRLGQSVVMVRRGNSYRSVVTRNPIFLGLERQYVFHSAAGLYVFLPLFFYYSFFKRKYVRKKYRSRSKS